MGQADLFGLNTGWRGLNIISHIWRDQFHPIGPIKNGPWGLRGPPKTAMFGHIWQCLAIHGPSWPIWVKQRLNKVEHYISHIEGPVWPLWTHRLPWLPQMGWTLVEHCWTLFLSLGGPGGPCWTHQKMVRGGPGRPLKPPSDHFRGYLAIFGYLAHFAKYGRVGYCWKDHPKYSLDTLTLGF